MILLTLAVSKYKITFFYFQLLWPCTFRANKKCILDVKRKKNGQYGCCSAICRKKKYDFSYIKKNAIYVNYRRKFSTNHLFSSLKAFSTPPNSGEQARPYYFWLLTGYIGWYQARTKKALNSSWLTAISFIFMYWPTYYVPPTAFLILHF